jgi:hypothetical protein
MHTDHLRRPPGSHRAVRLHRLAHPGDSRLRPSSARFPLRLPLPRAGCRRPVMPKGPIPSRPTGGASVSTCPIGRLRQTSPSTCSTKGVERRRFRSCGLSSGMLSTARRGDEPFAVWDGAIEAGERRARAARARLLCKGQGAWTRRSRRTARWWTTGTRPPVSGWPRCKRGPRPPCVSPLENYPRPGVAAPDAGGPAAYAAGPLIDGRQAAVSAAA